MCHGSFCLTDFSVREPTFDINLQFLAAGSWPEKDKMYQSVFLSLNWVSFPSEIKGNIKFCYSKQYCSNRKSLEENLAGLPYSWCFGVGKERHIWTAKYWISFFFSYLHNLIMETSLRDGLRFSKWVKILFHSTAKFNQEG